jgi:hypothetical protein
MRLPIWGKCCSAACPFPGRRGRVIANDLFLFYSFPSSTKCATNRLDLRGESWFSQMMAGRDGNLPAVRQVDRIAKWVLRYLPDCEQQRPSWQASVGF